MILCLKAIDSQQEYRDFSCTLKSVEAAFNALNSIVESGSTLLEAYLIDEQTTTRLPTDAFDGESFGQSIQELQEEWEDILNKPVGGLSPSYKSEMALLTHRRIEAQKLKIIIYTDAINQFTYLLQLAKTSFRYEPRRSKIIHRYQAKIQDIEAKLVSGLFAYTLLKERYQELHSE